MWLLWAFGERREELDQWVEFLGGLLRRQGVRGIELDDLPLGRIDLPDVLADQPSPVVAGPDHVLQVGQQVSSRGISVGPRRDQQLAPGLLVDGD
jgi:hypothetical protein